jgi:hypothetical protein
LHSIKVSCAGSNQFRAFYAHLSVCEQIEPGQDAINYISLLKNAAFEGSAVDAVDTLFQTCAHKKICDVKQRDQLVKQQKINWRTKYFSCVWSALRDVFKCTAFLQKRQ